MTPKLLQILAAREGGQTLRCHTVPHVGHHDVAQHTHHCLDLLLLLHPNPSIALIKAVHYHDKGERWVGDLPAPVKWFEPLVCEHHGNAEMAALQGLGLYVLDQLTPDDFAWLNGVDKLELYMWARDQRYGFGSVITWQEVGINLESWFDRERANLPYEIWEVFQELYEQQAHHRVDKRDLKIINDFVAGIAPVLEDPNDPVPF